MVFPSLQKRDVYLFMLELGRIYLSDFNVTKFVTLNCRASRIKLSIVN